MKTQNLILVLAAIVFVAINVNSVSAWEERLAECAALGITPENCPDDDSVLVPPTPPVVTPPVITPTNDSSTGSSSSGRGSGNSGGGFHYQWIFENSKIINSTVCLTYHYRLIEETENPKNRWFIDFEERKMKSCFERKSSWFYEAPSKE